MSKKSAPPAKRGRKPGLHVLTVRLEEEQSTHLRELQRAREQKEQRNVPYNEIMVKALMDAS